MPESLQTLVDDLAAEQAQIVAVLLPLPNYVWDSPAPAEGWTLRDCVAHLAETDETATRIAEGRMPERAGERDGLLTPGQWRARNMSPEEVLQWYQRAASGLVSALRTIEDGVRIIWAGRPMSARSYVTARLMEHWSHGLDIHEAAGVESVDTDRLRHVALLGCITREFAYRNRGLTPPQTALYVELTGPSGAKWAFGPANAPDRIKGSASDFCRVVTQRIHPTDTGLVCEGPHAEEFLTVAQAFAGPPGAGRPARTESERSAG